MYEKNEYGDIPSQVGNMTYRLRDFFEAAEEAYGQDKNNERLLEFIRTYECPNKNWY